MLFWGDRASGGGAAVWAERWGLLGAGRIVSGRGWGAFWWEKWPNRPNVSLGSFGDRILGVGGLRYDLPKSPGHPFYQKLNGLLAEVGFDDWVESRCQR